MVERPPRYQDAQIPPQLREFRRRLASLDAGMPASLSSGASPHQLLAAVETMQLGVTIADESGVVLYANPAQARMYGVGTPEDIIGQDVSIFCLEGYRDRLTPERLGEMKSWRRESVNVRKDGSVFPVRLLSDVVRSSDGEPMGVITTCEDLTEVKLAETERNHLRLQIRHSYTLENLGAMAGDLARDFKDMLAIVLRNTGPFLEDLPLDGEAVRSRIVEVDSAVSRMAVLTDQLLACSGQGGMIPLLSTHPGEGSRFQLFFPVAKRTAASGGDIPAAARLESVRKDAPPDVLRGMAPARADWPTWLPVSFGKRCPCCGSATHRTRTAWYARPVRFFLPGYSSTRKCFDCYWVGLTLHRG